MGKNVNKKGKNSFTPTVEEVMSECAWCKSKVGEEEEVFSVGGQFPDEFDASEYDIVIPIDVSVKKKNLWALISIDGSESRLRGRDFNFLLCSEKCAIELQMALVRDGKYADPLLEMFDDDDQFDDADFYDDEYDYE